MNSDDMYIEYIDEATNEKVIIEKVVSSNGDVIIIRNERISINVQEEQMEDLIIDDI